MTVYRLTQVDRDLLLAGADLEAVLADRERERLEPDERTEARLGPGAVSRPAHQDLEPGEDRYAPSTPVRA